MSEQITVYKHDDVYFRISAERGILNEISDYFMFKVPGYRFNPKFRNKMWDGNIRLFNMWTGELYVGLHDRLEKFAKDRGYDFVTELSVTETVTLEQTKEYINSLQLTGSDGNALEAYDYQISSIHKMLNERTLLVSPTSSGKSLIIYVVCRWLIDHGLHHKILLLVPTIQLVQQMASDFKEYSQKNNWDVDSFVHQVYTGKEKVSSKKITVSTWQSQYKFPKDYFKQFGCLIVDEAHLATANSLKGIAEKMTICKYKFGLTGTLSESKTHKYVLEGMFGPVYTIVTTKQLMQSKRAANLEIYCVVIKYPKSDRKAVKGMLYKDEVEFLISHAKRYKIIRDLALRVSGNSLLLFNRVEKHGIPLFKVIKTKNKEKTLHLIHGKVDGELREEIRKTIETEDNALLLASYGTLSTGTNIRKLFNIIFSEPYKSRIKVLQSIGRGLRTYGTDKTVKLFDIVDDLSYTTRQGTQKHNHVFKHFLERVKYYSEEGFKVKIITLDIEG